MFRYKERLTARECILLERLVDGEINRYEESARCFREMPDGMPGKMDHLADIHNKKTGLYRLKHKLERMEADCNAR